MSMKMIMILLLYLLGVGIEILRVTGARDETDTAIELAKSEFSILPDFILVAVIVFSIIVDGLVWPLQFIFIPKKYLKSR